MKNYFSNMIKQNNDRILDVYTTEDDDLVLCGSQAVFNLSSPSAERSIKLMHHDVTMECEHPFDKKPLMMIKCKVDCSVNNITIKDNNGTTLYVLNSDYSTKEIYLIFKCDNKNNWILA